MLSALRGVMIETLPAGCDLSSSEITALVNYCLSLDNAAGIRDSAIIGVLYTAGLRRSELVNLTLADSSLSAARATKAARCM
jgi:site-specific recombinase XerD